jgi:hypothetical protein
MMNGGRAYKPFCIAGPAVAQGPRPKTGCPRSVSWSHGGRDGGRYGGRYGGRDGGRDDGGTRCMCAYSTL